MKPEMKAQLMAEYERANLACVRFEAANTAGTLTRADNAAWSDAVERMEDIAGQLKRANAMDTVAGVNASILRSDTVRPVGSAGHGEDLLRAGMVMLGRSGNQKFRSFADDDDDTLKRVVAHGVAADGTAPTTIEGDLVKFVDANRYAVNAARRLPMPDNHAPNFKRPRLTQVTSVAQQVTEGDVLASQRLTTTGDTVTKQTFGGVLALSEQEIDWTDPAALGLAIQDLAQQYAIATDTALTAAITAAVSDATETILAASQPTAANFITAITSAAQVVYNASKHMPDTLFCDLNWWQRIAAVVDTTGRPLFSVAGGAAYNTAGTANGVTDFAGNVLGLKLVVDPTFASDTLVVAASSLVEFYEQNKGLLTINAPSTLEVQYAYRGYIATNVYPQALAVIEAA